jgi:alcohol dehydrogenase class IV
VVSSASIFERYQFDTEVILGANCLSEVLGLWCTRIGSTGILVFGRGQSVPVEQQESLIRGLQSRGLTVQTIRGACADSPVAHLRRICDGIDPVSVHWVAAIGGGSVIDTAKILALKARNGFAVHVTRSLDELRGRAYEFESLPLLAAPTCVGSGAEVSALADILLDSNGVRVPITSPVMYPKLAVVDCTVASPPQVIQASAMVDAAAHLFDPWLNSLPGPLPQEDTTVALLRALVRLTRIWRCEGFKQASLLKFATISHLAVRPGLARSSAAVSVVHRIEHVLSPRIGCSHGEGLALILPAFLRWMEAKRRDLLRGIADQFDDIFDRAALPSTLVTDWLRSLPVMQCRFSPTDSELGELTDIIIASFSDSSGLLPGGLSIGAAEVQAILRETREPRRRTESSSDTSRPTHQAVINMNRVFGGPMAKGIFHVVITPIRPIFEMLCRTLGATSREGWFPTAVVSASDNAYTVLMCPPPGSCMAEDCLGFLWTAVGRPDSLLFVGFAGSLAGGLHCGDVVAPTYVWPLQQVDRTSPLLAAPLKSMNGEPFTDRAWTVRSVRRLTDESEELLEAWRWAGVDLVDLESSGVATFCTTKGIPFSVLLVVSDLPLEGVSLWAQPPFTSETIMSRSIERVVSHACRLVAHPNSG